MALDAFLVTGLAAAVFSILALIRPLLNSFLSRSGKSVKITVESPDGSVKKLTVGTEPLSEEQLKSIVKVLTEADHGRAEARNSKS
jgi:hypothetical protein